MKRLLIILVIISSFFTFQSALKKYDQFVLNRFVSFQHNETNFEFAISGDLTKNETNAFQKNFEQLLNTYNIYAYQMLFIDNEYILWTNTKDESYLNHISLTKGMLSSIDKGDYHFSNDGDSKGDIFNPIKNKNYKIYHLGDFSNKHKSIFNPYTLYTDEVEPESTLNHFVDEFRSLYPNIVVEFFTSEGHSEDPATTSYSDLLFVILTSLMVILVLNVIITQQAKKIQILKLEGHSNWKIYKNHVLSYLFTIALIQVIVSASFYFYYIETSLENAKPFLVYLLVPNLVFFISLFGLSIASFLSILWININSTIKGKSSLATQKNLGYVLKIGLVVFTTLVVLEGIGYVQRYYRIVTTEQTYLQNINNLYNTTYTRPEYLAAAGGIESAEKLQKVAEYLDQVNDRFEMSALDSISVDQGGKELLISRVSATYTRQNISEEIANQLKDDQQYLIIPEKLLHQKEEIVYTLEQDMRYGGFSGIGEVFVYSHAALSTVIPNDYLRYGLNVSDVIFFIDQPGVGMSLTNYFKYDGDLKQAIEYFDQVSLEHGAQPTIMVESVADLYRFWKAFFLQEFKVILPIFLMIILAIVTNTYQLSILNCEINRKKYAILKSQGSRNIDLIWREVGITIFLLLVAETILYQLMSIPLGSLISIIMVYLIIDIVVLWVTVCLKMRKFSEILR